mmetsp:Transcript_19233/g.27871  ORF Transcript_19233/g.27871 Transcript_19233/m.27871 type:complete len:115 (+) Transcript_19233:217-561(+)
MVRGGTLLYSALYGECLECLTFRLFWTRTGVSFTPKVCLDSPQHLSLRHSEGKSISEKGSSAGNAYARLVERSVFQRPLFYSITIPESLSVALIENRRKVSSPESLGSVAEMDR